jgi:hypothetical protein
LNNSNSSNNHAYDCNTTSTSNNIKQPLSSLAAINQCSKNVNNIINSPNEMAFNSNNNNSSFDSISTTQNPISQYVYF